MEIQIKDLNTIDNAFAEKDSKIFDVSNNSYMKI